MENWFATWFDSPYYHLLYKNRDQSEAATFIENLIVFLKPEKGEKALDLACGKGRHSLELSTYGLDVLGVDLSPNSIEHALQFKGENLNFRVHDMRKPLGQSFDLIFNLFTSFGYFDDWNDNQKVINAMHDSLTPKGKLVIDFMNAKKVIANLVSSEKKTIEGITFNITREVVEGFIIKHIKFEDKGHQYHFQERVAALTLKDFKTFLKDKFKLEAVFGNYQLEDFDAKESDRLILVAEKN